MSNSNWGDEATRATELSDEAIQRFIADASFDESRKALAAAAERIAEHTGDPSYIAADRVVDYLQDELRNNAGLRTGAFRFTSANRAFVAGEIAHLFR